ncbi:two-pore potassium channel 1-like [Juglans microcarpa x Juglans regia]|uniref:two-pore potassium channel 1-like n=1 Tax=Juglans microcarpa x Juglans regia TaxID=2249226 RepID=UPI001B7F5A3C|nr:two-pore potassium channel 1-like [Juglans microcarpa x Juglans regia]
MAGNDAKVKGFMLSGLVIPTSQTNMTDARKRSRRLYQCSKSAKTGRGAPNTASSSKSPILEKLDPTLMQIAIFSIVSLIEGTLCFYNLRPHMKGKKTNALIDTVYFCIVTMATVGYGDLVPDSIFTKLLACALSFTGVAMVGLLLSNAADTLVKKHEDLLVKALDIYQNGGPTESTKDEVETINIGGRYKCLLVFMLLLVLIITGTTFLATVEKLDLIDAFYCVSITITTLGYGDESFKTKGGRVFAVFWILASTITLAQFFACIADLNTGSRHGELVKRVLSNWKTIDDELEAVPDESDDLDHDDSCVRAAEIILYKLQEMGKITEDDISLVRTVREEFEHLDIDC